MANLHDWNAAEKLAGCFHEAGHAIVGQKLGRTLKSVTRNETVFEGPNDDARIILAGREAVVIYDRGVGRHDPEDGRDKQNLDALKLSPLEVEAARAETISILNANWQEVCNLAFRLHRAP